jgi:hypothetical protein
MPLGRLQRSSEFVKLGSSNARANQHRLAVLVYTVHRGRTQDRAKVAGGQKHETSYEAKKTGTSPGEVRQAVKKTGNSRRKVVSELKK